MRRSDLLVVPALAVYGGLFVAGAAYFLAMSFWSVKSYRVVPGFTLDNYAKTVATHLGAGATTISIAFAIALSATLIGFCYAWIVRFRAGSWAPALLLVALVTLFGGYLMKIYAWKTMLGSDGAINSALIAAGLVDQPIKALLYSPFAVVLTLTHFLLPFSILPIFAALRSISDAEVDSARDLGAGPVGVLTDILIPRARGGIIAAFALAFLIAVGEYLTPQLVGGTMAMYGQLIAPQFGTFFNWPLGAAMSFSILAVSLLILLLVYALLARVGRPA